MFKVFRHYSLARSPYVSSSAQLTSLLRTRRSYFSTSSIAYEELKEISDVSKSPMAAKAKPEEITGNIDLKSFKQLSGVVHDDLIDAIERLKFSKMTPVQEKSIKPILETNRGMVARAKTGTGKTLAFGIPLLHDAIFSDNTPKFNTEVRALIIAPTRDLAHQISAELRKVLLADNPTKYKRSIVSEIQTVVGAERRDLQLRAFQGKNCPSIVVGTPGRLIDILNEPLVAEKFGNLRFKVLDEADRLLDDGFKENLLQMDSTLKDLATGEGFRTILFSATIDKNVLGFAKQVLGNDFVYVNTVDPNEPETHEKISQSLVVSDDMFKCFVAAVHNIATLYMESREKNTPFKPIIFLPTIKSVEFFGQLLEHYLAHCHDVRFCRNSRDKASKRLRLLMLHGSKSQAAREAVVRDFKKYDHSMLVTSNVGARGMDFPNVTNVFQVNLPSEVSDYIHRIGRTARGDSNHGEATLFITEAEEKGLRLFKDRKIKFAKTLTFDDVVENPESTINAVQEISTSHTYGLGDPKTQRAEGIDNKKAVFSTFRGHMGYLQSVASVYRLSNFDLLASLNEFYKGFCASTKRPFLSPESLSKVKLNNREKEELYESPRSSTRSYGDNNSGRYERSNRFERSDRFDKSDRYDRSNRSDRSDKFERSNKFNRSDRFEKPGNYERSDRFKSRDRKSREGFDYLRDSGSEKSGKRNNNRNSRNSKNDDFDFFS
ncbi:ATP-dependent RNA helicase [Saccharomycopsis crataegensis]|uniref:ATP-dependent RNA helicase n=1 Tax=Saccharomycopsis crataegensis TaxID=43959 RepID=A0AAV5QNU0_9ASCO|nr:ATP-dependent RNA helicase [Saccharomycopsis crataegensis]